MNCLGWWCGATGWARLPALFGMSEAQSQNTTTPISHFVATTMARLDELEHEIGRLAAFKTGMREQRTARCAARTNQVEAILSLLAPSPTTSRTAPAQLAPETPATMPPQHGTAGRAPPRQTPSSAARERLASLASSLHDTPYASRRATGLSTPAPVQFKR